MSDADDQTDTTEIEDIRSVLESRGGVIGLAAKLNEGIFEASRLDTRTFFLVRAAAMAAMGSGPTAWAVNTELMDSDVSVEDLLGVLVAISPIVGTARTVLAAENIAAD
jgi:hypothetical protein